MEGELSRGGNAHNREFIRAVSNRAHGELDLDVKGARMAGKRLGTSLQSQLTNMLLKQ